MNESRIRICFTVDSLYAGGAERYIALLAGGLDRARFATSVIAKSGRGLDAWCDEVEATGVRVRRLDMNMPFRPLDAIGVHESLTALKPHLVHINVPGPYDGQMGLLAPVARSAGASRVVVTEHLPRVERLWKRELVKRLAYRFVDRVVTICEANVEPLIVRQHVDPRIIDVVYNGIPVTYGGSRGTERRPARDALGIDDGTVAIVFLGSLIERKGVGVLLDALAGLNGATAVPWRLYVIGEGGDKDRFVEQALHLGIEDRVTFRGSLTGTDVERLLCGADLLVVPSFMEGMPYVILEAMACSLPVAATRIDGIPEAVVDGDTAMLVPPGDSGALASVLRRFVDDSDLRRRAGKNGRLRFEAKFTLDRHIARMEQLYREVLEGRPSGPPPEPMR